MSKIPPGVGPQYPHVIVLVGATGDLARRKLRVLDDAEKLEDLAAVPGNRLEALSGDRKGQHSGRVNDQWRICFLWRKGAAEDVEIVDYH